MVFGEIRLENIGPIRRAAIGAHRLSVFVGPNNSGKSIASRIMHSARRLDVSAGVQASPDGGASQDRGSVGRDAAAARADAVLGGAGMDRSGIVTHSMPSGRIELAGRHGAGGTALDFGPDALADRASRLPPPAGPTPDDAGERSIYVPAGRTGTIQMLFTLMRVKNDLFNSVLRALPAGQGREGERMRSGASLQIGAIQQMPEYLGRFYSIVLEALSRGPDEWTEEMFSRVFPGSIKASKASGTPTVTYVDPLGAETVVGSAVSGVASALPIMVAMSRIGPSGTLVVEDPEEHIEPIRQIKLVCEMAKAASARDVSVVITTHSPFVAHAALGLVGSSAMDPEDLGMYYFRRGRGSYTDVERIPVNKAGEAEQELFDEAIDALAYGSVVPDAP